MFGIVVIIAVIVENFCISTYFFNEGSATAEDIDDIFFLSLTILWNFVSFIVLVGGHCGYFLIPWEQYSNSINTKTNKHRLGCETYTTEQNVQFSLRASRLLSSKNGDNCFSSI